jgi:hypothetical protein
MEALQVVMIVAIAAVCLLLIKRTWPSIQSWFSGLVSELVK